MREMMIWREIIQNRKNRLINAFILTLFSIILFLYCFIPWYSWYKRVIDTEEFRIFEGTWLVTEYLDETVEYHAGELDEEYYRRSEELTVELKNKYIGNVLYIKPSNITYFTVRSEVGHRVETWDALFLMFRQPPTLNAEPPYWAGDFYLKNDTGWIGIVIDNSGEAFLFVKGSIFQLERVEE